jgi:tRNA threonylcarbamoyladenosine biosynthesis protein TsaB
MLLALDTATEMLSLSLHDGERLLIEQSWHVTTSITAELAPAVRAMLDRVEVAPGAIEVVGVCIGPGIYTDVRAGVAFAKGLAVGSGMPVVGITSLDVLAYAAPYQQGALIAALPIGRGRVAVGRYQWRKGRWTMRGEPSLMTWASLVDSLDGPASLTGELDDEGLEAVREAERSGLQLSLLPAAHRLRRAGHLAELAWMRLKGRKETFPAADLLPLVLKPEAKAEPA